MLSKKLHIEINRELQKGFTLETLGPNFRRYINALNPRQEKLIVTQDPTEEQMRRAILEAVDPTGTWQVGASTDDCLYRETLSWFSLTAGYSRVGYIGADDYEYGCGQRWTGGVWPPRFSIINSAYMYQTARYTLSGTVVNSIIRGEKAASPLTFSTLADYLARPRTSASVNWDNIPAWTAGVRYQSPDISSIIQELVNTYEITAVVLFWDDYDDRSTHATGCNRAGYSWNADPALAPELEITYTPPETRRRRRIFLRSVNS